jgi:gas vesicle protein
MSSEMLDIEKDVVSRSNNVVDSVFRDFYSSLEKAENASALQSIVSNADVDLKNKLTEKMAEVGAEMHRKIQLMMDRYAHEMEGVSENMGIFFKDELGIKGSFITKIPSFVWTILDIVGLDILLPGGVIIATIAKTLIYIFKAPTLGDLVKTIALKQLKTNLDEAKVTIKQNIQTQLHENLQNACDEIKRAVEDNNARHIEAVRTAAANANNETSSNIMALKSAKEDLERALAALN